MTRLFLIGWILVIFAGIESVHAGDVVGICECQLSVYPTAGGTGEELLLPRLDRFEPEVTEYPFASLPQCFEKMVGLCDSDCRDYLWRNLSIATSLTVKAWVQEDWYCKDGKRVLRPLPLPAPESKSAKQAEPRETVHFEGLPLCAAIDMNHAKLLALTAAGAAILTKASSILGSIGTFLSRAGTVAAGAFLFIVPPHLLDELNGGAQNTAELSKDEPILCQTNNGTMVCDLPDGETLACRI